MGVIKRQTIKSSLVSYVGVALGAVNTIFIFTAFLSAEEIGLYRVLFAASTLFSSISLLGSAQLQVRFFSFFEDKLGRSRFMALNALLALSGFLLYILFFNIFKEEILDYYRTSSPLILDYYPLIYFITFFLMLFTFWSAYSRTLKRIVIPNLLKELTTRLGVLIFVLLYAFSIIVFDQFLYLVIGIYATIAVIMMVYAFKLQSTGFKFQMKEFQPGMLKRMLKFGLFSTVTGVAGTLVGTIDALMISSFKTLDQTGIYSIAFFMGVIIEIPKRSLAQIASPIVARAWKNNDLQEINVLYKKSSINQFVFGSFIFICLLLNLDYVFEIMPSGELYAQGKNVVMFIALGKLFDMLTGVNGEIISNSRYYYFNLIFIVFLAVVTVLTNQYFIPIYGIDGAAMASLISLVAFNTLKLIFLYIKYKIQPFSLATVKILLLGSVTALVVFYIPDLGNPFINLGVRLMAISLLFIPSILRLKVSEDINEIWANLVKKLF